MEDGVTNFFGSAEIVSYLTTASFDDTVTFYKDEMEAKGWTYVATGSVETTDVAVLNFENSDKTAIVSISADPTSGNTVVLITLTNK
jgi:hypothetical protein